MDSLTHKQLFYRLFGKYDPLHRFWGEYSSYDLQRFRYERLVSPRGQVLYSILYKKYIIEEDGLKIIARDLGTTYTLARHLLALYQIPLRTGRSVVTNNLRGRRRSKAISEHKAGIGWFDPTIRRKIEKSNARGVQGYFFNESLQKDVWLRSTYEYIFAKWLNRTHQRWDVEVKNYMLDNFRSYRPDFFLYDSSDNLIKIVEIKGYWDHNSDKAKMLNDILQIEVAIIYGKEIREFITADSTYEKELEEWKKVKRGQDQKN